MEETLYKETADNPPITLLFRKYVHICIFHYTYEEMFYEHNISRLFKFRISENKLHWYGQ